MACGFADTYQCWALRRMASIEFMLSEESMLCVLDTMQSLSNPSVVPETAKPEVALPGEVEPTELSRQIQHLEETVDTSKLEQIDPGPDPLCAQLRQVSEWRLCERRAASVAT
jgi:hypothetical protein